MKYSIYLLMVFLLCCFGINSSQLLNSQDYNCILNLYPLIDSTASYTTVNSQLTFCTTSTNSNIKVICNTDNSLITSLVLKQVTSTQPIDPSNISCFISLTSLDLTTPYGDISNIINYSYATTFDWNIYITSTTGIKMGPVNQSIKKLILKIDSQPTVYLIYFSWLKQLDTFILRSSSTVTSSTTHLIKYFNDLAPSGWNATSFESICQDFPSFRYVYKTTIRVILNPGYDNSIIEGYFKDLKDARDLFLHTPAGFVAQFPNGLKSISSTTLYNLNFYMTLAKPSALIDLSNNGLTSSRYIFENVGKDFNFNGKFPLILKNDSSIITFRDGYLNSLDLAYFDRFTNLYSLSLSNNSITAPIGSMNPLSTYTFLYLNQNQLTGTLDRSFCLTKLDVSNNKLTGTIPTCFTCFFVNKVDNRNRFINNLFDTDINNPPPCTTIIPNLESKDGKSITLFGYDVGIYSSDAPLMYALNDTLIPTKWSDYREKEKGTSLKTSSSTPIPNIVKLVYGPQKLNFTVSWSPLNPVVNQVSWVSNTLTFDGSYFNYNISSITITLDGSKCNVLSATFYQIKCSIVLADPSKVNILTIVKVDKLSTQISLNPYVTNTIKTCSTNLNGCNYYSSSGPKGYCNTQKGECLCLSGWQGKDCSTVFIQCPIANSNLCSNLGSCNNITGVCTCNDQYSISPSCSPIECLDPTCSYSGYCNKSIGECVCDKDPYEYSGKNCSLIVHFVSAIEPSKTEGGNATFYGVFGSDHKDLVVMIGSEKCYPFYQISNSSITCFAPPGNGVKSISVIQNNIEFSKDNMYEYIVSNKMCLNNCTSPKNGKCNTENGFCECLSNFGGDDCSYQKNTNGNGNGGDQIGNPNINNSTGTTSFNSSQTHFELSFISLLEVSISGSIVSNYTLQNNWNISRDGNESSDIYQFNQTLDNGLGNTSVIIYKIEHVKSDKQYSFAGVDFKVDSNSIKLYLEIKDYKYSSSLNTLKLLMESSVNSNSQCLTDYTNIDTVDQQNSNNSTNINYLNIKKDGKLLYGKFINKMLSDGRSTFVSTSIYSKNQNSVILSIDMPHCSNCQIDPDFSVLLNSNFKSSCEKNERKWVLPVSIVVGVVGFAIVSTSLFIIYRKSVIGREINIKMKKLLKKN